MTLVQSGGFLWLRKDYTLKYKVTSWKSPLHNVVKHLQKESEPVIGYTDGVQLPQRITLQPVSWLQ